MTGPGITAHPLAWPEGFPRTAKHKSSKFRTTLAGALNNVRTSLSLFGIDSGSTISELVISSNVTLGVENPRDPGVAVYFKWWAQDQVCIPVDRYPTVAENLQAIHHIVAAHRIRARAAHPDHGGSNDAMSSINRARDLANAELGYG